MTVRLGSNIAALQAQRRLGSATASMERVSEQLSSGMRINRASDDAAGLAISKDLNVAQKVYTQAIRNGNDGLSLLSIAETAINNLTDIVTRIRELGTQSANGTLGHQQRKSLDAEAQALSKEYSRISLSTSFNGLKLFDGTLGNGINLQLGFGLEGSLQASLGGSVGNGTFSGSSSYDATGQQLGSNAVELADLNGDGILDMVSVGQGGASGIATVRLGSGDGTFGTSRSYQMDAQGSSYLALADINNDGIMDMISSGSGGGAASITMRLGVGDGTFGSSTSVSGSWSVARSVKLFDVNDDGILDMISADDNGTGITTVRMGNGNGTFGTGTTYTMLNNASLDVTLADLNGDGILDLVSSGTQGAVGGIGIRLGTGGGQFGNLTNYSESAPASNYFDITTGDLNGDGVLDLITSGIAGRSGFLSVRMGQGDGTFGTATSYSLSAQAPGGIRLGDLNGDGILDLVAGNAGAGVSGLQVFLGTGTGTFGSPQSFQASSITSAVALGDLNRDGVLDVVTSHGTSLGANLVLLGNRRDGIAGLSPFSLKTKSDSMQAMSMLDTAMENLSKQRGVIGAYQGRIATAVSALRTSADNFAAAESRIMDVDFAEKTSEYLRIQILQKAAASVLTQANFEPQLALKLLQKPS